jgi:hypothetical protein
MYRRQVPLLRLEWTVIVLEAVVQFRDGGDAEVDRRCDYGSPEHLQRADQMSNIF